MKEAEKEAERIIEMFMEYACANHSGYSDNDIRSKNAKQCALLHVDGIIEADPTELDYDETDGGREEWRICTKYYWQQVKQAIENK